MLPGVVLSQFVLGPHYRRDTHTHERPGVVLGLEGTIHISVGTRRHQLTIGEALVLPGEAQHSEAVDRVPTRCLLIEPAQDSEGEALFAIDKTVADPALQRLARLFAASGAVAEARTLVALWRELLLVLCCGRQPVGAFPERVQWLSRAVDRLRGTARQRPALGLIAGDVGVSREHLARVFKQHTGCTVEDTCGGSKCWRRGAIFGSLLPISSVAQATGFADQSHLTRTFKRYLCITPLQYRCVQRRIRSGRQTEG